MKKLSSYYYSNAYILVSETITTTSDGNDNAARRADEKIKK